MNASTPLLHPIATMMDRNVHLLTKVRYACLYGGLFLCLLSSPEQGVAMSPSFL